MATQTRNDEKSKAKFKEVIQYSFLPDEAPKVVAFLTSYDHIAELTETLGLTGYEVSQSYNKKRENWSVCIKCVDPESVNAGMWLYGNGNTLHLAYCSAYYKHFEVFQQGLWDGRSNATGMTFS